MCVWGGDEWGVGRWIGPSTHVRSLQCGFLPLCVCGCVSMRVCARALCVRVCARVPRLVTGCTTSSTGHRPLQRRVGAGGDWVRGCATLPACGPRRPRPRRTGTKGAATPSHCGRRRQRDWRRRQRRGVPHVCERGRRVHRPCAGRRQVCALCVCAVCVRCVCALCVCTVGVHCGCALWVCTVCVCTVCAQCAVLGV